MKTMEGKFAVITGAASGIGRSILEVFLSNGARCVAADIVDVSTDGLDAFTEDVEKNVRTYKVDVSNRQQVEGMIDFCIAQFGAMDIICNNAGIADKLEPIAEMKDDVWSRLMKINLDSVMFGTRYAVQYFLKESKPGVIVNTASLSGVQAGRGGAAYTASKFAVVGLTKNTAFMYADKDIRCNCICPASTVTNLTKNIVTPETSKLGLKKTASGTSEFARSASADEIAAAAAFLASDNASYINGVALVLDAGWSCY